MNNNTRKVLAEINIAKALYPIDSPQLKDFNDNLDYINSLAEQSDGFIWRLEDDSGNATGIQAFDDPRVIVNMSVWASPQALKNFMFKTDHITFFKRKSEWFEKSDLPTYVLWWIEEGHTPTLKEGIERLTLLQNKGDNAQAFSFKQLFEPT